mgnify:CR=1 FL=1
MSDQPTDRDCATCAHWEPSSELWGDWLPYPEDDAPRWGACGLIELPGYGFGVRVNVSAYVQDGSDYRATLHARSDFGCNLHAPAAAESDHQ